MYRILSLDGGGMRGLVAARILHRLEQEVPGWVQKANLFAGTSTGGIIAIGLANGAKPKELIHFYLTYGPQILFSSWRRRLQTLSGFFGAKYDHLRLKHLLRELLGRKTLGELDRNVLLCAFDLDNDHPDRTRRSWAPRIFHNFEREDGDGCIAAYEAAVFSSATPTLFPSVDGYIDGGVVANNPSLAALALFQAQREKLRDRPELGDVVMLSIGTGKPNTFVAGQQLDWGRAQWFKLLLNVIVDGGMKFVNFQCQQFLGARFHRISPILSEPIDADDCNQCAYLLQVGDRFDISETVTWLRTYWTEPSQDAALATSVLEIPHPETSFVRGRSP